MPRLLLLPALGELTLTAFAVHRPEWANAPELVGTAWLNTPGDKPITLASRAGKPNLVAFWTFACSDCQANLPADDWLNKI